MVDVDTLSDTVGTTVVDLVDTAGIVPVYRGVVPVRPITCSV